MRFRALMHDLLYMREFQNIIATLAKLSKECVMILSEQHMHLIVNEEHNSTSAPLVWVSIGAKDYFPDYKMTPGRQDQEYIVLLMSAGHLNRALAVLRNSSVNSCKLKLQHIQFPCLSIIASVVSPNSAEPREVAHDVPVQVLPASDWPAYQLPRVPHAQLRLNMPLLSMLRSLLDKLKNITPNLVFHASAGGELNVVAEAEMATITTCFRHLLVHDPQPQQVEKVSCSVDCRKASSFFSALQLPTEELIIGIDREHCMHLQLDVRQEVVLHSIFPAVCV